MGIRLSGRVWEGTSVLQRDCCALSLTSVHFDPPAEVLVARCAVVNKAVGEKLAISDSELASTVDACKALITQGVDISGAEGSSSSASQKLAAIR